MVFGSIPIVGGLAGGLSGGLASNFGGLAGGAGIGGNTVKPGPSTPPLYQEYETTARPRPAPQKRAPTPPAEKKEDDTPYLLYAGLGVAGVLVLVLGYRALSD